MPEGGRDISLFLHGFFFLNDSRTEIQGMERGFPSGDIGDQNGIQAEWNRACGQEGLLAALLPALATWLNGGKILQRLRRHDASSRTPLFAFHSAGS